MLTGCLKDNCAEFYNNTKKMTDTNVNNNNELKTSKGYRLKISTHAMIKSLQELTGGDADGVITRSCILLYKQIIEKKEENLNQ